MRDGKSALARQGLVVGAAALLFLIGLGRVDLWAPDEPRYAQVAEEIRSFERGPRGLVLLSLNGEVYDQKPPLYYWLAALAGSASDRVTETAARLPSALSGVAVVALTAVFGARLLGSTSGALAAAMLATTGLFVHLTRRAQLDVLLTLCEGIALVAFWRIDRGIGSRRTNLWMMHAALGLGVLAKGPVGFVVPLLVMAVFLASERRLASLRGLFAWRHLALSVLPGIVWIALATLFAPDGFFQSAVVDNIYGRYLVGTSKVRPWHYLITVFPLGTLPWSVLWPVVAIVGYREVFAAGAPEEPRRAWRFLLVWAGTTLAFFTLSTGKRDLYLLTCYPAVALLAADATVRALRGREAIPQWIRIALAAAAALLAIGSIVVAAAPVLPNIDVPASFALSMLAILVAAALAVRAARGGLAQTSLVVGAIFALELVVFLLFFPALEAEKSPRLVAESAASLTVPGTPIGLVESQPLVGALAYYSGRRIEQIGPAEELRRYFEEGGRVAVIREEAFERAEAGAFAEVRARFRSGRRALVVVTERAEVAAPEGTPQPSGVSDAGLGRAGG